MTRKNNNSNRHQQQTDGHTKNSSVSRTDLPKPTNNPQLSLYIPQSRRKNSPRRNLASPIHTRSASAENVTADDTEVNGNGVGGGGIGDDEEEEQSEDVDDDNICLICVAKCTCGKTEQQQRKQSPKHQQSRLKQESSISPVEPHYTRQSVKLRLSSPILGNTTETLPKRRGRPPKIRSPGSSPIKTQSNGHAYDT